MARRLSGWNRLGIVLSGAWILAIITIAAVEFFLGADTKPMCFVSVTHWEFLPLDQESGKSAGEVKGPNPFDQFDPPAPSGNKIRYLDEKPWTRDPVVEMRRVIRYERLVLIGFGPLVGAWALGFLLVRSFCWVRAGFGRDRNASSIDNVCSQSEKTSVIGVKDT